MVKFLKATYGSLFLALSFTAAFTYNGCAISVFKSLRSGKTYNHILQEQNQAANNGELTFETLGMQSLSTTNNDTTESLGDLTVNAQVNVAGQCVLGDAELIKLGKICEISKPLLITVKDAVKEVVARRISLSDGDTLAEIMQVLSAPLSFTVEGSEIDIFICIDSNLNDRCTDEMVIDLNMLSADLKAAVDNDTTNKPGEFYNCQGAGINTLVAQLERGLIILHKNKVFAMGTASVASQATAIEVQEALKNAGDNVHAAAAEGNTDDLETMLQQTTNNLNDTIELNLVQFEAGLCPVADDKGDIEPTDNETPELICMGGDAEGGGQMCLPADQVVCWEDAEGGGQRCRPADGVGTRTDGCFAEGTKIKIGPDQSAAVEQLRQGQRIMLADGTFTMIKGIVLGPEKKPMVNLSLNDGKSILVTTEHPMMTDRGVVAAIEVTVGDKILVEGGSYQEIKAISREEYDKIVYNFDLYGSKQSDHLVVSNGIITGDLYLQKSIKKEKPGYLSKIFNMIFGNTN